MIQKVALNQLKIGYVQVKSLYFNEIRFLFVMSKVLWVLKSREVGAWKNKFQNHTR